MRCLKKNKQTVYYKNLVDVSQSLNNKGLYDGSLNTSYGEYVKTELNIGRPLFKVIIKGYGVDYDYERVLLTDNIDLPVSESTIFKIENTEYRVNSISKTINTLKIRLKQAQ